MIAIRKSAMTWLATLALSGVVSAQTGVAPGWLSQAPSDSERSALLEQQLRGFDVAMWEVGERFERAEQAIVDGNHALAAYHWEKIRLAIENGLLRRPKRRPNSDALFLGDPWRGLAQALQQPDRRRVVDAFGAAKAACIVCHTVEGVGFINEQPMFRRALPSVP